MAPKDFKYETYRKCTDIIKSRFGKLEDSENKIIASDPPLTQVQIRQLNTIFAELKKKRADFELNLQRIIETDDEKAEESVLSKDVDDINDLYVSISSLIATNIALDPTTPHSAHSDSTAPQFPTAIVSGVKLPKLNLQTFDGSSLKWISFINLFDTTVHKSSSLSNVAKFQYLLSVLTGEPLNLVKSLNLTAANYLIAYQLLRDRYHNIRRLTTLHLNHLLDMPLVSHGNPKQLRGFITMFYEHTESLKALDHEITENNPLLSAHLLRKLDNRTVQRLEQYRESKRGGDDAHTLPKVMEIIDFLNFECSHIEDASLHSNPDSKAPHSNLSRPKTDKRVHFSSRDATMLTTANQVPAYENASCFCCRKPGHKIYQCQAFKNKSPNDRYQIVKENQRCVSCLGTRPVKECQSTASCLTCHKKHHSLLHFKTREKSPQSAVPTPTKGTDTALTCTAENTTVNQNHTVLLSTALVKLTAVNGRSYVFRALLDSGSMSDFISERAAQLLGTRRRASNLAISGLAQTLTHTKGSMNLDFASLSAHLIAKQHSFHILDKISVELPRMEISPEVLKRVKPFVLADPTFHKSGPIDILIGSSLFPKILTNESHSLGADMPYALGTIFGFVITGTAPCSPPASSASNIAISLLSTGDIDLHSYLQRFWTQEELPSCKPKSAEDLACDELFNTTHSRDPDGRYIVRLPFTSDISPSILGT